MKNRTIAEQIFLAGINSVLPEMLIANVMSLKKNHLVIGHLNLSLKTIDNIYVIGAGKASALMGAEVEKTLGSRITEGYIVVKYGYSCNLKYIRAKEAGHPVPDSNGFSATDEILKIADKATEKDLVICLLSGGGSALLADYPEGSSPEDMIKVNNLLVNSGANISEINAVRKHLSSVKGGQLARTVFPATLISMILSDVPGDPPDVIASGPTTADPTTFHEALQILDDYSLTASVPGRILNYLKEGAAGLKSETPKPGDVVFKKSYNILIGTNRLALEAARKKAIEFKMNPFIIDDQLQGDTSIVSEYIVATSLKFKFDKNNMKPVCLLFGGETTIAVSGHGLGGRNQHLALSCAVLLQNHSGITLLAAGTDGSDGPTDAAGAVVDSNTTPNALLENIDPAKYLSEFDSYHFFKKAGGHIITGPTMTNVMDIVVVIVE